MFPFFQDQNTFQMKCLWLVLFILWLQDKTFGFNTVKWQDIFQKMYTNS